MATLAFISPRREFGLRAEAREKEVERALSMKADWIFTIDSDQTLPLEDMLDLLDPKRYRQRNLGEADIWVIDAPNKGQDDSNIRRHPDGTLAYFTISCCLIHRSVFEKLAKPWFKSDISYIEDGVKDGKIVWNVQEKYQDDNVGEDVYFARRVLEHDLKVEVLPNAKSLHHDITT